MLNVRNLIAEIRKDPIGWAIKLLIENAATIAIISLYGFIAVQKKQNENVFLALKYYVIQHPIRALTVSSIFLLLIFSISISVLAYKYARMYAKRQQTLLAIGFHDFHPHETLDEKTRDWDDLIERLNSNRSTYVYIMAVTGEHTLGRKTSPLFNFINAFEGELRILLIKPFCKAFCERAHALQISHERYVKEIEETIDVCRELKAAGRNVSVKLYEQKPIWKMILTEQYLWLQYYSPSKNVEKTPVYSFFGNTAKTSLYYPLADVFVKRWAHDNNDEIDLDKYQTGDLRNRYKKNNECQ